MQKKIIDICNCSDPQSLSLFNSATCETVEEQTCMTNQYDILLNSNFISHNCSPLCPLECNCTKFKTSIYSIELTGDLYADFINSNGNLLSDFRNKPINSESAKNNFVYIDIFYNSLSYTETTESPLMDIVTLLANIGGTLGLFLGLSLIQIFELFDIFIEIIVKLNLLEKIKQFNINNTKNNVKMI